MMKNARERSKEEIGDLQKNHLPRSLSHDAEERLTRFAPLGQAYARPACTSPLSRQ
jgi:hypothetical protein